LKLGEYVTEKEVNGNIHREKPMGNIRLEDNTEDGLEQRNTHESGRPSSLEKAHAAMMGARSGSRWSETLSIGVALVVGWVYGVRIVGIGRLMNGRLIVGWRKIAIAIGLVVAVTAVTIARVGAKQRLAGLEPGSHGGHVLTPTGSRGEGLRLRIDDELLTG
jgi:hypothetical protein